MTSNMVAQCERTQLSVLWAAKGVQVSFAVHHHAELSTTGHLDQGLPVVGNLKGERQGKPPIHFELVFQLIHSSHIKYKLL